MKQHNARVIDIPYWTSQPLQLIFQQSITVNIAGNYVWPVNKQTFTPNVDLNPDNLYLLQTITFASDTSDGDYKEAITTMPRFHLYLETEGAGPLLRQPVYLPMHLANHAYTRALIPAGGTSNARENNVANHFLGSFAGQLIQTPNLVGKPTITLTAILSVQEVGDAEYIDAFKSQYKGVF